MRFYHEHNSLDRKPNPMDHTDILKLHTLYMNQKYGAYSLVPVTVTYTCDVSSMHSHCLSSDFTPIDWFMCSVAINTQKEITIVQYGSDLTLRSWFDLLYVMELNIIRITVRKKQLDHKGT